MFVHFVCRFFLGAGKDFGYVCNTLDGHTNVHPRVGGISGGSCWGTAFLSGTPPLERGKLRKLGRAFCITRHTPAHAGETGRPSVSLSFRYTPAWAREVAAEKNQITPKGEYPRVCGASPRALDQRNGVIGIPPRALDKPRESYPPRLILRDTPACAG